MTVLGKITIEDANVPTGASNDYYYFLVTFYPGNHPYSKNPQTAAGLIRVHKNAFNPLTPEYTVTVEAREDPRYLGDDRDPKWPVLEDTMQSVSVKKGNDASLTTVGHEYTGYTWEQWGQGANEICKTAYQNRNCTVSNVTANQKALAYYVRNRFQGKMSATVNNTVVSDTGYVSRTEGITTDDIVDSVLTKNVKIDDCGNGCDVNFKFNL